MNLKRKLAGMVAGAAVSLTLAATATAQVSADAILDKLVAKGILTQEEAEQLKKESLTNTPAANNNYEASKFKMSKVFKDAELFGDLRFRFESRSAKLGPEAGGIYDAENRWRYALRIGVRGDLVDDFYYGLRLETSPNERSPWNTFGNAGGGQAPYVG